MNDERRGAPPPDESTQPIDLGAFGASLREPDEGPAKPARDALATTGMPTTVRAAHVAHALAAKMARPGLPSARAAAASEPDDPPLDLDLDLDPDLESGETQTRLPTPEPAGAAAAHPDLETTVVTSGDELPLDALGADPEETRMGRLDNDAVRAAFAAAESVETTGVFDGPVPPMALPDHPDGEATVGESLPSGEIEEVDADELESVDDLDEIVDELARTHAGPLDDDDSLPRFTLDEDESARPADRRSAPSTSDVMQVLDDELVDANEPAAAKARRSPSGAPRAQGYSPPARVKPLQPAYAQDPDEDERQLAAEGKFVALVELYRLRLESAEMPAARATLLHKIASVHEWALGDRDKAFDLLLEAFDVRPFDEELAQSIDRVAKRLGRVGEVAERARANLHTADIETRVALLGHLVYWYERHLARGAEAALWVTEIERLDKGHPLAMRRAAQQAAVNGDVKAQRDYLLRALDRSFRRDDKVALHLQLASSYAGMPEAARHYESAIAIDPSSIVALQGIERMGREQGKHAQVQWALERQVDAVETDSERVTALLQLGELEESKFLRREKAAEIFERVLVLEPSNPTAMRSLERCYHALRDWPKLARILRTRAENTYDKKQQIDLLETAAEVYESKLGDLRSAIDVHRDLLHADPQHRRALADLARLSEKVGDWAEMATFKARLAEVAPTKRQASQMLVQLGDFLSAPERDPLAARMQYERAAEVDPGNAAAWEALQRVAAENGDDRRVVACLEARANALDSARQRAAVWVELARFHDSRGEERSAREAYERAIDADRTNEAAAAGLLETWTREERWADAAPLCELLVNAAVRDKDGEALFTRVRLQTRIAAALGDADKAMSAALAALESRPDDRDAQADLIAVCSQCRESPKVVARAKGHLARIAEGGGALGTDMRVMLAKLQREAGEIEEAMHTLERARAAEPDSDDATRELGELYLAQGDFPRACKMKVDLARNATTAEARFQLLCEAAEIWEKRAGEIENAVTLYEEARRVKPHDPGVLHTLARYYGELGRWDDLAHVLETIATTHENPDARVKSLLALAEVTREKLHDPVRAAELLDQVLDVDRKRLECFEELVRSLTEAKDWQRLELAYRKMIARVKDDGDPALTFALFQQLGLVYRDRLEDAALAYEALEAAARIRPDDTEVRKIVTELLVVTDNLDNAVARLRGLVALDPHDAELYAELYELFLRQHYFDKAWCAINVLASMRPLSEEQQRFHEDYAPMPLPDVPGQIVEQAWRSHLFHAELDPALTEIFAWMTPAVARMRHANLGVQAFAGRPFTPAHSYLHDAIRATFANAAEILGIPIPELLLGDPSSPVPFAPALAPFGAILLAPPAVEARSDVLVYAVGKRLAEQRPELAARAFFPSATDLSTLLAAAVRVSRHEGPKDTAAAALDGKLSAVMLPHEREGIRAVVSRTLMEGAVVDVKGWSHRADFSSMRAGLLLSGDVDVARRAILAEPQSPTDPSVAEKLGELYKFATSDLYSDLRGAIGVAVEA